ncbi:MAG: non-canonical purine NTP pyrophosphatase, partial [Actinobacteria bacterium]|nr:non-canonical purine NTP pyrophosphatase [Actinomycetota bacterium]
MKINFITGNKHKVDEAQNIFSNFGIEIKHVNLG